MESITNTANAVIAVSLACLTFTIVDKLGGFNGIKSSFAKVKKRAKEAAEKEAASET